MKRTGVLSIFLKRCATVTLSCTVPYLLKAKDLIDELVQITDEEAREMTHRLWKEEGLYCGVSSGANVYFAMKEARKSDSKLNIVTLLNDHMDRYLTEERYVT